MLSLAASTRVSIAMGATDMRKGFDGLCGLVTGQLDVGDIQKLWSDPILRFSNVLDGLSHESVIVCEGDADCRFFAAILEAIHGSEHPQPDVHFSLTGGKDRLYVVVSSTESKPSSATPIRQKQSKRFHLSKIVHHFACLLGIKWKVLH